MSKEAISLDLDGPTIWRIIPRQWDAVKEYKKHGTAIYRAPSCYPKTLPCTSDHPLTLKEIISFPAHQIRFVFPDAARALNELKEVDVFGNTGRPDKNTWQEMTRRTLRRGGILERFQDIFHRPIGIHTTESKLCRVGILRNSYSRVAHVDDNPANALPIAATFKDVPVYLICDLSTGYLLQRVNLEKDFPNVTVVSTLRQALEYLYL